MGHIPFLPVILDQIQPGPVQGDPGHGAHCTAAGEEFQGVHLEGQGRHLGHQIALFVFQPQVPGRKGQIRAHVHGFHLQLSVDVFTGRLFHQGNGPLQSCGKDHLPQDQVQQDQDPGQNAQPSFPFGTHRGLRCRSSLVVHRLAWNPPPCSAWSPALKKGG